MLFYANEVYAVAEWKNYILYPAVIQNIVVKGDNLLRLLVLATNLLDNFAVPEDIVGQDIRVAVYEVVLEQHLVVGCVFTFVIRFQVFNRMLICQQ